MVNRVQPFGMRRNKTSRSNPDHRRSQSAGKDRWWDYQITDKTSRRVSWPARWYWEASSSTWPAAISPESTIHFRMVPSRKSLRLTSSWPFPNLSRKAHLHRNECNVPSWPQQTWKSFSPLDFWCVIGKFWKPNGDLARSPFGLSCIHIEAPDLIIPLCRYNNANLNCEFIIIVI